VGRVRLDIVDIQGRRIGLIDFVTFLDFDSLRYSRGSNINKLKPDPSCLPLLFVPSCSAGETGTWSIVTAGVTGTFNPNANTPGATFTHATGGIATTITLRWTVTNSPCTAATADVAVTIKSQPVATVGGPQTICQGGTTATLGGNTPPVGATGTWSIVTAGVVGTFNPNATTPGATFTHTSGAIGSTVTLRWTVSNAPCTDATADVVVTIKSRRQHSSGGRDRDLVDRDCRHHRHVQS
jgi:hypothetical protein